MPAKNRRKIEYGPLVEAALRTVVREVLGRLVRNEVPPPHHFYITFRTQAQGVVMADYLRGRYPNEMTVVLQHQYWDLEVDDEGFKVTLSFNDMPERLEIPFSAVKVFADPAVDFGLQFTLNAGEDEAGEAATPMPRPVPEARPEEPPRLAAADDEEGGAEIVTLDRFRKK